MDGGPPSQFPTIKRGNTLLYLGKSMNPTLRDLDVVEFVSIPLSQMHKGDVIVIKRQEHPEERIIHRIISISPEGIRTQGDNNDRIDPWILLPSEIEGIVISAWRGKRKIKMYSGLPGYCRYIAHRIRLKTTSTGISLIRAPYCFISSNKISRMTCRFVTLRLVDFSGSDRSEVQVYVGPIYAGRLVKGKNKWEIRPPFHILINPDDFPTINENRYDSD